MALSKRDKQDMAKKKGAMHNGEVLANKAMAAAATAKRQKKEEIDNDELPQVSKK